MFARIKSIAGTVLRHVFSWYTLIIAAAVAVNLIDFVPPSVGIWLFVFFITANSVVVAVKKDSVILELGTLMKHAVDEARAGQLDETDIAPIVDRIKNL